jgi:putative tryptophan/tyrosine transport system substrate-binding protein
MTDCCTRPSSVAVLRLTRRAVPAGIGQFAVIMAPSSLAVELAPIDMHDAGEIEHAITAFKREPNGSPLPATYRDLIISLATRYRLPNVYAFRYYPASGGLASYGPDTADEFKRAADHVDRILKGEKPADLPVQSPTKYQLVINLKTAKALGLTVPKKLLVAQTRAPCPQVPCANCPCLFLRNCLIWNF